MTAIDSALSKHPATRVSVLLLLALVSLALVIEGSQPTHSHEDGRAGLYNTECPLSQLAAVHSDGWAPASLAIASPKQVAVSIAVTSSDGTPSPSASLTDSRAPPLA